MKELSLHILDLSMNSIRANCTELKITITEISASDTVTIKISDNGDGMDKEFLNRVTDPFTTSRSTRKVGLGIPLMKANAEACDGYFNIYSVPKTGTTLEAQFKLSHIDRPIMGNISSVASMLFSTDENINVIFKYRVDDKKYTLSSDEIKEELMDISIQLPEVKNLIEKIIRSALSKLNTKA